MRDISQFRQQLFHYLQNSSLLRSLTESVTIVGSFHIKNDISAFSDIDTIIVIDRMTKQVYDRIIHFFNSIPLDNFGLADFTVIVNPTFGPLKFNQPNSLVFHVMIYDIDGHRKHVIASPFTCYEWQQFSPLLGRSLYEIYPSNALALEDIAGSRRSIASYLTDLDKEAITYRSYQFDDDAVSEVRNNYFIDQKHQTEYAYHILKFLMLNILKILHQQPIQKEDDDLAEMFANLHKDLTSIRENFQQISFLKKNSDLLQGNSIQAIRSQVTTISDWFSNLVKELPRVYFYRHLPTILNDGRFLGSLTDPDIMQSRIEPNAEIEICYTSQLRRAKSTATLLSNCEKVEVALLNEINYGKAEGLTYTQLKERFPKIVTAWENAEDIRFPEGENLMDVAERLNLFIINNIIDSKRKLIGVVTHNVVIRVLLARLFSIPLSQCYRFQIPHGESISCRIWNHNLIPEFTPEQRVRYRDQYLLWKNQ